MGDPGGDNTSGNWSVQCLACGWSRGGRERIDHIHRFAWVDPARSMAPASIVSYAIEVLPYLSEQADPIRHFDAQRPVCSVQAEANTPAESCKG